MRYTNRRFTLLLYYFGFTGRRF